MEIYALPIAVATLHEYAGATAATALIAGAAGGYTGNYNSSGFFSGDFTLGCCEKAGMALGTIASLAPSKITSKAVGRILQSEVAGAVINQATKKAASVYARFSARKAIQEVGAGAVEKVTKAAAGKIIGSPNITVEGMRNSLALSSKSGADFARHLRYSQDYGKEGVKFLQNGRIIPVRKNKDAFLSNLPSASLKDLFFSIYLICTTKRSFKSTAANRKNATLFFRNGIRYYGQLTPPRTPGEMIGARYVHKFNPLKNSSRGWMEMLDSSSRIRQVRPQLDSGHKIHYLFDKSGNLEKIW